MKSACAAVLSSLSVLATMAEKPTSIFPQNITIEDCRAAIKGQPGFREARKGDYVLFNYGTFTHKVLTKNEL
jgi:hypothetical protein